MTQPIRESMSALLDDEASELDLQRILKGLHGDEGATLTWQRYHLQSAAMRNHLGSFSQVDLSGRVREAIANESQGSFAAAQRQGFGAWLKPFAGVAVAASVTAVILTSTQLYNSVTGSTASGEAALAVNGNVSAVLANSQTVGFGNTAAPVVRPMLVNPQQQVLADEMARQRLDFYLRKQAANASLNTNSGLMPYARTSLLEED